MIPFIKSYNSLKNLKEILGALDWGTKRVSNIDTFTALESIQTSFDFMGFGFSKYLKAKPELQTITDKTQLSETILWKKLENIFIESPKQSIRILMMNPLAHEIET